MRGSMAGVFAAITLAGCGSDGDSDSGTDIGTETLAECVQSPIELTCGTGEEDFIALTDGATMTMVHGPQGGWHLWTSISAKFAEQDVALLPTITIPSEGDVKISETSPPGDFVALKYDGATCTGSFVGQQARLDPGVIDPDSNNFQRVVCDWEGDTFHVRMDLTDLGSGRTASCEANVVIALDPADVGICAQQR